VPQIDGTNSMATNARSMSRSSPARAWSASVALAQRLPRGRQTSAGDANEASPRNLIRFPAVRIFGPKPAKPGTRHQNRNIRTRTTVIMLALAGIMSHAFAPAQAETQGDKTQSVIFAAGCFWCTEADFDKVDGVRETISGFIGGSVKNPTYRQVVRGGTGHTEAVRITYDPKTVSFEKLLDTYWKNVDPTDADGQFCDRGSSYRPAIFVTTDRQLELAKQSKAEAEATLGQDIIVPVQRAPAFYVAEDDHQNFYRKKPWHYARYRTGCRRDARLKQLWGQAGKP